MAINAQTLLHCQDLSCLHCKLLLGLDLEFFPSQALLAGVGRYLQWDPFDDALSSRSSLSGSLHCGQLRCRPCSKVCASITIRESTPGLGCQHSCIQACAPGMVLFDSCQCAFPQPKGSAAKAHEPKHPALNNAPRHVVPFKSKSPAKNTMMKTCITALDAACGKGLGPGAQLGMHRCTPVASALGPSVPICKACKRAQASAAALAQSMRDCRAT